MKRSSLLILAALSVFAAACSKEAAAPKPAAAPAAETAAPKATDDRLSKIPILPGFKYYTGGPRMKADEYGRFRLSGFNGEVQQPPSRGMIFAAKIDGGQMEYRVWGNGMLLGVHRGTLRDGIFWQEYAEGYRDGKLVARERTVNNDATKHSEVTTEDLDPDNGEVIRTQQSSLSYMPPAMPEDMDSDSDAPDDTPDDAPADGSKAATGKTDAPPAAPATSAPAAPAAGK